MSRFPFKKKQDRLLDSENDINDSYSSFNDTQESILSDFDFEEKNTDASYNLDDSTIADINKRLDFLSTQKITASKKPPLTADSDDEEGSKKSTVSTAGKKSVFSDFYSKLQQKFQKYPIADDAFSLLEKNDATQDYLDSEKQIKPDLDSKLDEDSASEEKIKSESHAQKIKRLVKERYHKSHLNTGKKKNVRLLDESNISKDFLQSQPGNLNNIALNMEDAYDGNVLAERHNEILINDYNKSINLKCSKNINSKITSEQISKVSPLSPFATTEENAKIIFNNIRENVYEKPDMKNFFNTNNINQKLGLSLRDTMTCFVLSFAVFIMYCLRFYSILPTVVYGFFMGFFFAALLYFSHKMMRHYVWKNCFGDYEETNNNLKVDSGLFPRFKPGSGHIFEGWINIFQDYTDSRSFHLSQSTCVYLSIYPTHLLISYPDKPINHKSYWNDKIPDNLVFYKTKQFPFYTGDKISSLDIIPKIIPARHTWNRKYPLRFKYFVEKENHVDVENDVDFETSLYLNLNKMDQFAKTEKSSLDGICETKGESVCDGSLSRLSMLSRSMSIKNRESDSAVKRSCSTSRISTISATDTLVNDNEVENSETHKKHNSCVDKIYSSKNDAQLVIDDKPIKNKNSSKYHAKYIYFFSRTDRQKEEWFRKINYSIANNKSVEKTTDDLGDLNTSTDSEKTPDNWEHVNENEVAQFTYSDKPYLTDHFNQMFKEYVFKNMKNIRSIYGGQRHLPVFNAIINRIFWDVFKNPYWTNDIKKRIQHKLSNLRVPFFIDKLTVNKVNLGFNVPIVRKLHLPQFNEQGLWISTEIEYKGGFNMEMETKINLLKLKEYGQIGDEGSKPDFEAKKQEEEYEFGLDASSDDESNSSNIDASKDDVSAKPQSVVEKKSLMNFVDKLAKSKYFQSATNNKIIKRAIENVSQTTIGLVVEVNCIDGVLMINIPPPPTCRIWYGFLQCPNILFKARPKLGTRVFNMSLVTDWIEKKLLEEFQKVLVLPNMDDIVVPVLTDYV